MPYLPEGEIPADPLADLETTRNRFSVWYIEEDRSNLERVATALASAGVHHISNFDYALFDYRLLDEVNVKIDHNSGGTADEDANTKWHREFVELSASTLAALAKAIFRNCEKARIPEREVATKVWKALVSGKIDRSRLTPEFLRSMEKYNL